MDFMITLAVVAVDGPFLQLPPPLDAPNPPEIVVVEVIADESVD